MLYKILIFFNKCLSLIHYEIRKKNTRPYYYLQSFTKPDFPNDKGIYTVPIDKIISPHFFSYGSSGWHYYCEFLKQYDHDKDITYDISVLKKYYDTFQPKNISDILFYDQPENAPESLKQLPALLIRDFLNLQGSVQELKRNLLDEETQLFGPISDIYGEEQFIRCKNAYRLIKKHGYLPDRFEDGYIGGYFIKKSDDFRFMAFAGKHRLAALNVLGHHDIKVTCPYKIKMLDYDQISNWPIVQSGLLSANDMRTIIDKHFDENGIGFAKHLNLLLKQNKTAR